ncbi:MAG: hypothetical protein VX874_01915 [Pseudomonadota bacterium]|nr:hypothetical protein [Pseudomonadota bacterium]
MSDLAETLRSTTTERSTPRFAVLALRFTLGAVLMYACLYVWAEIRVRETGETNRFHQIWAHDPQTFDHVILGASHAMPLSYGGLEATAEAATDRTILNLSNEGAGPMVNGFVYDYFARKHAARHVIYVLDSFAFNAATWNEERIEDRDLFVRAPFDPALVATFMGAPWAWGVFPDYLTGFSKINGLYRLGVDRTDAELTRFDTAWRANERIDAQRIKYLYDVPDAEAATARYLAAFDALLGRIEATGATITVLKLPTPPRYRDNLPGEPAFDAQVNALLEGRGIAFVDHSTLLPGDENYYDTDHLNRTGVEAYLDDAFLDLLR